MSRIAERFEQLAARGEGALIAYIMAGDPDPLRSLEYALAVEAGGADIIEFGLPFSDPVADGPTIQAAGGRALRARTTPRAVFQLAREFRARSPLPLVLMSYYNPIWRMGEEAFLIHAAEAGADGVIVPDLPVEEAPSWINFCRKYHLNRIFLATPETDEERLQKIAHETNGFLYLVSRYGTTGAREELAELTARLIERVRSLVPAGLPLAVGFGIARKEHVQSVMSAGAQGVIVGSALVEQIAQGVTPEELMAFVQELKDGTRPAARAAY
jgi:tryptophan synthase alpha chain